MSLYILKRLLASIPTLLIAAVADCFILTFRAVARASRFEWISLGCTVDGVLDRAAVENDARAIEHTGYLSRYRGHEASAPSTTTVRVGNATSAWWASMMRGSPSDSRSWRLPSVNP